MRPRSGGSGSSLQGSLLGPGPSFLKPMLDLSHNAQMLQSQQLQNTNEKQRVFTGVVTNLHEYFGVVDEEVFFQLSVVKGRIPQVGEKVLVKAVYTPNQSVKWNAVKVQTLSNQPMSKAPVPLMPSMSMSQKPGILGATPQPLLSSHRLPSLLQMPQKYGLMQPPPPPQMPSFAMFDRRGRLMDQRGKKGRGNQDRGDNRGLDSMKRKDRLAMQQLPAKRARRDAPQYRVHFAGYSLEGSVCDAVEVIRRYRSMTLPKEFFDAQLCWVDSFPLSQPLVLSSPCHFHVMDKKSETEDEREAEVGAPDADPTYTVKVLLLDCPDFEGVARECFQFVDGVQDKKGGPHHPAKLIKFLMGKKDKEVVTLGGAWSPSLDGPNPEEDQTVLIQTAIRCVKELSGVDLSECTQWFRFMEFRYLHQEDPSYVETVVVFLPDVWHCVPSVLDWETLVSEHEAASAPEESEENESDKKEDAKKHQQEKKPASLPKEPSIIVHPNRSAMEGKFNCATLSLHELLEYRKQNVHYNFEVSLLAEQFQEMLQRDSAFSILKGLLLLPEKEEPEKPKEKDKTEDGVTETDETKVEAQEPMKVDEEADSADKAVKEESETQTPEKKGQKPETSKRQAKGTDEADAEVDKAESVTAEKGDTDMQAEDVLLLQEEEDEFGAEEEEKKSASNHSGVEPSHQDVEKAPAVILPKDVLVGFAYFDLNFCGYIQRRELEKIILTVGLHLSKEQVSQLVDKIANGISCDYTSLEYDREEYADSSSNDARLSEDMLMGNIPLLPPSNFSRFGNAKQETSMESGDLVSHNGAMVNMKNVLEKLERTEAGRAQVEHKVISLQQKLDEASEQMSAVEQSNKSLNEQLEELRKQISETEERLKNTEKLKATYHTQLQHSSRCLTSLMEEMQRIVNKNNRTIDQKSEDASS